MPVTPLMKAWTDYAHGVLEQPALELSTEMLAFMAGVNSTIRAILAEVENGDGDVTALIEQMNTDVNDFAYFMVEQHQAAAE